ncbi:MAG: hypothetical protein JJU15_04575 [Pararhodobacter sp.]|nr:hypothetical protein [Pararhodobacter sp.]
MKLCKPDLYKLSDDGRTMLLRAARCSRCGGLSFPAANYGCPLCGAGPECCSEEALSGEARLLEFITIHGKVAPGITPPIVVGEAELAPGIIEEIELAVPEEALTLDMIVQAVPIPIERDEESVLACRFIPKGAL